MLVSTANSCTEADATIKQASFRRGFQFVDTNRCDRHVILYSVLMTRAWICQTSERAFDISFRISFGLV